MNFFRDSSEAMQIAQYAMRANKGRGVLTTLGIIIGIVAVVLTMTAANGLQNTFRQSFASVGADVIYVSRMPWVIQGDFFLFRNRPQIDLKQANELAEKLRGKAIVNFIGVYLLLAPMCLVILSVSASYVDISWRVGESSTETDGLPLVYLLKTVIPAFAVLMLAQGASLAARAALVIVGVDSGEEPPEHPPHEAV